MSAFSTINVRRSMARRYLIGRIMEAPDAKLEEWLNDFLAERLYEAILVDDADPKHDDQILSQ